MGFTIKLNGSNYISEKTATAFEEALQEQHQVTLAGNGGNGNGNGNNGNGGNGNGHGERHVDVAPAPAPDYTGVLANLERGLAQSYDHQKQTLHVHEQYLDNQGEYARIFSQLMQQQNALLVNGDNSPERLEAALKVLESLSRSIDQFHAQQTGTLTVHDHFLSQQAEYTRAFIHLLQQQCDAALSGNGSTGNGHHGNGHRPAPAVPAPAPVVEYASPPVTPSVTPVSAPPLPHPLPPSPSPAPASGLDVAALTAALLAIVSEKTGYPAEMLELDMDMEADLGIDSIKRVEILGALQDNHPDLPEIDADHLAELRTLAQIIEYMQQGSTSKKA